MKSELSESETQVLYSAMLGDTVNETARTLNLSVSTIKGYRYAAIEKLGAFNFVHACIVHLINTGELNFKLRP